MSIGRMNKCEMSRSQSKHRHRSRHHSFEETHHKIGHFPGIPKTFNEEEILILPDPDEENRMGDILRGTIADPKADPVEEVRELRRDV